MLILLGITPTLPTFVRTAGEIAICQCVLGQPGLCGATSEPGGTLQDCEVAAISKPWGCGSTMFNMFTPKIHTADGVLDGFSSSYSHIFFGTLQIYE